VINVQTPKPEVKKSKITILKKPKEKVIILLLVLLNGIIAAINGSTLGALNGSNLIAKIDINITIDFIQFFLSFILI
jgi:hypothetical protein